ncbi:aldehyde dehydrogenase family protein [Desulfogranum marinum]|uniref:aldehyde dehydrogenase family protein n=1 Tax=Desulfogranum marinum TaxID=453220 RepID=UPI0029C7E8C1|nr:aldehyde dehydrogenase family protein [Desulfogranum marinum]
MTNQSEMITDLVQKVVEQLAAKEKSSISQGDHPSADGMYDSVDVAVACAATAQKQLLKLSLKQREKIIASIRKACLENNEELAAFAIEDTGYGRYEDKVRENILCAEKTPGTEDLVPTAMTGDSGLALVEPAPVGVIGALTPITNPTGTLINNTISMVAAGNTVVFNPHPSAKATSAKMVALLHKAIVDAGGPPATITAIAEPTLDRAKEIINHPGINMLVATGGKPVVKAVLSSGKKAIGAGAGNPPALVDETANIRQAAECIVNGASINNNIFCICEKEVIVVEEVADSLIKFMVETGKAYLLNEAEEKKMTALVVTPDGKANPACIGKNVQKILAEIGVTVGEEYRLAIFRAPKDHPLVWKEQMMPVIPIVSVKDIDEAIDFAVEVEQGNRHTAIMHSTNVEHLSRFARAVQTTIFVKNGPCYAGIGLGGEGHTSFTIAGPTGEGLTSARSFTRARRCVLVEGFRII